MNNNNNNNNDNNNDNDNDNNKGGGTDETQTRTNPLFYLHLSSLPVNPRRANVLCLEETLPELKELYVTRQVGLFSSHVLPYMLVDGWGWADGWMGGWRGWMGCEGPGERPNLVW
jgi:hypothetical protein